MEKRSHVVILCFIWGVLQCEAINDTIKCLKTQSKCFKKFEPTTFEEAQRVCGSVTGRELLKLSSVLEYEETLLTGTLSARHHWFMIPCDKGTVASCAGSEIGCGVLTIYQLDLLTRLPVGKRQCWKQRCVERGSSYMCEVPRDHHPVWMQDDQQERVHAGLPTRCEYKVDGAGNTFKEITMCHIQLPYVCEGTYESLLRESVNGTVTPPVNKGPDSKKPTTGKEPNVENPQIPITGVYKPTSDKGSGKEPPDSQDNLQHVHANEGHTNVLIVGVGVGVAILLSVLCSIICVLVYTKWRLDESTESRVSRRESTFEVTGSVSPPSYSTIVYPENKMCHDHDNCYTDHDKLKVDT